MTNVSRNIVYLGVGIGLGNAISTYGGLGGILASIAVLAVLVVAIEYALEEHDFYPKHIDEGDDDGV